MSVLLSNGYDGIWGKLVNLGAQQTDKEGGGNGRNIGNSIFPARLRTTKKISSIFGDRGGGIVS